MKNYKKICEKFKGGEKVHAGIEMCVECSKSEIKLYINAAMTTSHTHIHTLQQAEPA